MKPISLQFIGIHSYRGLQTVDFEKLGADGLFGIFGPTGSGKSTILDAITLALYGGVERASNNTRGIIHQLEKALEVSIQFQLGDDVYWVERRYERNPKDFDAAVAKQARLRRVTSDGDEVLASKPQEVTAFVEELLGIRKEEFSRAVVLPQGKFDQFLRLTGSERAAMLEHLFNLEQYGEDLVLKTRNVAVVCNEQLQKIEGEMQGMGDCSEEALVEAEAECEHKMQTFAAAQERLNEIETIYKEQQLLRELIQNKIKAEENLNRLELERTALKEKEQGLIAAERAEPMRELFLRRKQLNEKLEHDRKDWTEKNLRLKEATLTHKEAVEALALSEQTLYSMLPRLQEQKVHFQNALDIYCKRDEARKTTEEKRVELGMLTQESVKAEANIAAYQQKIQQTQVQINKLTEQRNQLSLAMEGKDAVDRCVDVLNHLEDTEKRSRQNDAVYQKKVEESRQQWDEVLAKIHEVMPERDVLPGDPVEEWTQALIHHAEKTLENDREAYHKAQTQNMAMELVRELHEGQPCPVCGSCEHPSPAEPSEAMEPLKKAIQTSEKRLRDLQQWERQLLKVWNEWNHRQPILKEAQEVAEKNRNELAVVLAEFEQVRGVWERDGLRQRKQEILNAEKQYHLLDQERETMQKRLDTLNQSIQTMNEGFQSLKVKEAIAKETLHALITQANELSERLQQITEGKDPEMLIRETNQAILKIQQTVDEAKQSEAQTRTVGEALSQSVTALQATIDTNEQDLQTIAHRIQEELYTSGLGSIEEAEAALMTYEERAEVRKMVEVYQRTLAIAHDELDKINQQINNKPFDETAYIQIEEQRQHQMTLTEDMKSELTLAKNRVAVVKAKQEHWKSLDQTRASIEHRKNLANELGSLLRGRRFVSFLAQENLRDMALEASYQLGRLTGQRYALELAKEKDCEFIIRDDYNGGSRRMAASLSGGEVFLTSLALALALSSKIQLRGQVPLGFFFLDEGFGTLDEEKLNRVMNALEMLHHKDRMVGVISHVKEMRERLPKILEVLPAGEDGSGSRIRISG